MTKKVAAKLEVRGRGRRQGGVKRGVEGFCCAEFEVNLCKISLEYNLRRESSDFFYIFIFILFFCMGKIYCEKTLQYEISGR